jgi:hypothetical protein
MRILFTIGLFLLGAFAISAPPTTYYISTSNGDWLNSGTWDIVSVPANDQTNGNDDITIDTNVELTGDLNVKSGTVIRINSGDTLIVNGNLILNNGSTLLVEGVLIINGNVTNNNNSDDVTINGVIVVSGDFNGGNGSTVGGTGSMDIDGSVTTDGSATVFGSDSDCITNCDNSADNPLPIELKYFKATTYGSSVLIEWATLSELNNERFIVEKTINGVEYEFVDEIIGAGNSNYEIKYQIIDDSPYYGDSYYRLTQEDFDGKTESFQLVGVTILEYDDKNMAVYPNPCILDKKINVKFTGHEGDEILVVLMDIHGRTHYSKVLITRKTGETIHSIDPHNKISAGTYIVVGSSNDELYFKNIVIQ